MKNLVFFIFISMSLTSKAQSNYCSSGAISMNGLDITAAHAYGLCNLRTATSCNSLLNYDTVNQLAYYKGAMGNGLAGSYSDFSSIGFNVPGIIGPLRPFALYRLLTTVDTCGSSGFDTHPNIGLKAFIDYNHNGVFTDSGENILNLFSLQYSQMAPLTLAPFNYGFYSALTWNGFNGGGPFVTPVPTTALHGYTRLRIVLQQLDSTHATADSIKPCGQYLYGETEDYTIFIDGRPPCIDSTIIAGVLQPANPKVCQQDSITLSALGTSFVFGLQYRWLKSSNGINYSLITGANFDTYTVPPSSTSAYYKLAVRCPGSNAVDTSAPIFVEVVPTQSNISTTICENEFYNGHNLAGNYVDSFINSIGCDSVVNLQLNVLAISYENHTDTICAGSSYLGYTSSGVYKDTFSNALGCDSIRTIYLTVNPATGDTIIASICNGSSYEGYTTSGTFKDTFLNSNGCDSIRTLVLTVYNATGSLHSQSICSGQSYWGYSTSGTYVDTFVNSNGCDSLRTLQLKVINHQVNVIATALAICPSTSSTLLATSTTNNYIWQPGNLVNSTAIVAPTSNTIYTVIASDALGCSTSTTVLIEVYNAPPLIVQPLQALLCKGDSLSLTATGGSAYQWQPAVAISSLNTSSTKVSPTNNTIYTVTTTDSKGCTASSTVAINIDFTTVKIVASNLRWCKGSAITLATEGDIDIMAYEWLPTSSYQDSSVFFQRIVDDGWIKVSATNSNACKGSDSVFADVYNCCQLLLPSAFSPNGDNVNEDFKVLNADVIEFKDMSIYNRWGQLIFYTKDVNQSWLGLHNGYPVDAGAYFYTINFICDGAKSTSGVVDVIK